MIPFLDWEHGRQTNETRPSRRAHVQVVVQNDQASNQLFDLVVDLDKGVVVDKQHLEGKHSYIDSAYMREVEKACMADKKVQAEIATLELPPNASVCVEPWAYATDGTNDMSERTTMVSYSLMHREKVEADLVV